MYYWWDGGGYVGVEWIKYGLINWEDKEMEIKRE